MEMTIVTPAKLKEGGNTIIIRGRTPANVGDILVFKNEALEVFNEGIIEHIVICRYGDIVTDLTESVIDDEAPDFDEIVSMIRFYVRATGE